MAKKPIASVDDYITAQPESSRPILEQVRATIRKALPAAEEVISYSIPAYRMPGGVVIYFAGWKSHFSLYPATGALVAAFKDDLAGYAISKGTIRFPLDERVPVGLIGRLAKFRARETTARATSRTPPAKKR